MQFEASAKFRKDLAQLISGNPVLGEANITDGHVPAGTKWPEEIRGRLTKAKVVVGDRRSIRKRTSYSENGSIRHANLAAGRENDREGGPRHACGPVRRYLFVSRRV